MILLRHLKAGFEKGGANRRCDCDGYRPDTLGGGIESETYWYVVAEIEGPENVANKQESSCECFRE